MGQELAISVGIRNELKELCLSARGQSEQLLLDLLWNGGRLVFPCRPWEGNMNPWRKGRYLSAELVLLCLSQFCYNLKNLHPSQD